jgi:hypothetical protein
MSTAGGMLPEDRRGELTGVAVERDGKEPRMEAEAVLRWA